MVLESKKRTVKGVRLSAFSKSARSNRLGLRLQSLSRYELDRVSLECKIPLGNKGAEGTGSDEKVDLY